MPKKPVCYQLALLLLVANINADDAPASFTPGSIGAGHLKLKSAEWQSLHDKQIITRAVNGSRGKEIAGFGAMVAGRARWPPLRSDCKWIYWAVRWAL